jgi:YfiH family protein
MKKAMIGELMLWQFENLSKETALKHFVTNRKPQDNEREFTLGYSGTTKEVTRGNRHALASALGIPEGKLYLPFQVHKTRILHVTHQTPPEALQETDALMTSEKGVCIAVMSADCVPILLYDARNRAVGAVHSGWRGTVARILEKTLHAMKLTFGTRGEDLCAGIGPSASQECYEVGEEVIESVRQTFGDENGLMILQANGKAKLDLWQANKIQLLEFGVKESRIEISNLCTIKNNDQFFSARKGDSGRFAAGIMIV